MLLCQVLVQHIESLSLTYTKQYFRFKLDSKFVLKKKKIILWVDPTRPIGTTQKYTKIRGKK
jgi:hypothetical protein